MAAPADGTTAQPKKTTLKKSLKKAGAKTSDDVDFEDLFGPDPEEVSKINPLKNQCKHHITPLLIHLCWHK